MEGLSTQRGKGRLAVPGRKELWLLYWTRGELALAPLAQRAGIHFTNKLCLLGGGSRGRVHRVEQAM